jgi:hemoglobin-like flavoprotein
MSEVIDSYQRACNPAFVEKFYSIFLDADPRIRPLFKNTDFEKQKGLLLHGMYVLLQYAEGKAIGKMAVNRLGESHSHTKMNIMPDMYPIWVDCLIKALAEKDPKFSPALEMQWRQALQKGIDIMMTKY